MIKKTNIIQDLFLRDKPALIMLALKTTKKSVYVTILSKETDCTYSHTIKILNLFKKLGLVEFEKIGRIKKVKLTQDGWDIANNLDSLSRKFRQINDKIGKDEKKKKKSKR